MNEWNPDEFQDPPAYLWPGYFWILNDRVDENKLIDQLRQMRERDARSVCLLPEPPEFRPNSLATQLDRPYLSPSYFELIRKLVTECRRLGMNYWLYDEGGWPSGGACGRVVPEDPEHFSGKVITASDAGPAVKPASYGCVPYPNLLNAEATKAFVRLTHEGHKPYIGEFFGDTVRFTFTDEPLAFATRPGQLTWTDDLPQVFQTRKGYDLTPFLADLLKGPVDGENPAITQARVDFYDVWSQLFAERYLEPIRDWCRDNGLLSAGHFGGEDEPGGNADHGFGHILWALRGLDVPGIDVIWRQIFPGRRSHQFPKYASSVARQKGQPFVLTETFAVYGNGLTPAQMKWVTDQQFVRGTTLMVMGCFPYSTRDHFMAGERTHFGPTDPLWKYMDLFHGYTARLAYLLTRGQAACTTAAYFDIRGVWAGGVYRKSAVEQHDRIADMLLKTQRDFDYLDDDVLTRSPVRDGALVVGAMAYDAIVVPDAPWMDPKAKAALDQFRHSGGRVLAVDQISQISPTVQIDPPDENLRVCKRTWDVGCLYFVTNEADRTIRVRLTFAEEGPITLADPETGKLFALAGSGNAVVHEFNPWGSAVFLFGVPAQEPLPAVPENLETTELNSAWTIKALRQFRVGTHDFETVDVLHAKTVPAQLGDWGRHLGYYFSGDAVYTLDFELPAVEYARLDLGEVRYASGLIVNDVPVGRRVWRPFAFDITDHVKPGPNRIHVTVTNTLANALLDPRVEEEWEKHKGTTWPEDTFQYDKMARKFERESLESGLFGPIRLSFSRK